MPTITRREALAGAAAFAMAPQTSPAPQGKVVTKGRLRQSVCRWCYAKIPLPEFFAAVAGMGLTAVDLLSEKEWPIAREHGLICSMGSGFGGSIADGLNVKANHEKILAGLTRGIPIAAAQKVPNLITFFGNRRGMGDRGSGRQLRGGAEPDQADSPRSTASRSASSCSTARSITRTIKATTPPSASDIVKAVGSPRVKLLYDIYHMQIMEGDVIRTIRDNREYFAHFHTGGVPGRHELDDTQEINWRTVATAIADTGFQGYFAHEFIPVRDPLTSLREAVALCDV